MTDWFSVCIISPDVAPICLWMSISFCPLLVNQNLRYLNFSTWGRASLTTRSEQRTLFWPRTMASVLQVLILIPAVSYTTVSPRAAGPCTMRPKGPHHLQTTEREYWEYHTEIHPPLVAHWNYVHIHYEQNWWQSAVQIKTSIAGQYTQLRMAAPLRTVNSVSLRHMTFCQNLLQVDGKSFSVASPNSSHTYLSFQVFVSLTAPYPLVGTRVSALLPPEGKAFSN